MPIENEDRIRYEWLALRCQTGEPAAFEDLIAVMEPFIAPPGRRRSTAGAQRRLPGRPVLRSP